MQRHGYTVYTSGQLDDWWLQGRLMQEYWTPTVWGQYES
jgi:hypothetical protein